MERGGRDAARPGNVVHLRLTIHPSQAESLAGHLTEQGFAPTRVGPGELEVLFPASPALFAAAVDLELWEARGGSVTTLVVARSAG
jgi:hypothetical protein